jgi:hypothetical protein
MQYAMILPINHAHTAVAGPPEDIGAPNVAGTDPSTPRMDIAYETVDHREKCRRRTCQHVGRDFTTFHGIPTGVYPMRASKRSSSSAMVAMMF